jgi:cell wall-associated NlpC family hydrolase
MRYYYSKKVVGGVLAVVMAVTLTQPMFAEELNIEEPSAGAALAIENYIAADGDESDLASFLPEEKDTTVEENKTETKTTKKKTNSESELFSDIAIAKVAGGAEGYVRVRRIPSTKGKMVGKIYNNCGARILETTDNGWYKIVSGNCTGYIKAEYFVTGSKAQDYALDDGYVFANIQDTGIHVRKSPTTDSDVVTNVYNNETYVIKKFSKNGDWVKIKIKAGVSGWVSSEFVKVSVDMDTAITIAEEKAQIKREKEEAEKARQAELAAQQETNNNSDDDDSSQQNSDNSNNTSNNNSSQNNNTQTTYGESSGGGASAVVAYAKQFLGNPYVWGGSSLTNGTDCSGFTMSVYAHFGYSLNRSSYTQVYNGREVSLSALEPGDLLFYKYSGSTISHVAIYIGGGQIIHASTESTGIIISSMGSPCAARRIIN